jgi:two-component system, NarL family, invasion response regulator UvrY
MMTSETKLSVLLVDDHAVVREGYRRLLERRGSIAVVGEASDASQACGLFRKLAPDVVVMDIALPDVSGLEAARRIIDRNATARILMFSMYEDVIYASRALQSGAKGYVTKVSAPQVLVEAVHSVANGREFISPDIAQKLALRKVATDPDATRGLTSREFEILGMLVKGMVLHDIAEKMGLNVKTIANYQSAIKQKIGAETTLQLARIGAEILQAAGR